MERKVARPLDNGAIQRVNGIFNLPTELVNEKGETIFVLINTFNRNELFNLSNYWFSIHIKGSKYNTIETFISEEIKKLKIVQGWFDATKEKEYFFSIQHYIDYLKDNFKRDIDFKDETYKKNGIAVKLLGLTEDDKTVFFYIKRVLTEYNITAIEGREILLEMQGTFDNELRKKRLPEVVKFLEDLKALPPQQTKTKTDKLKAPELGLFCSLINKIGIDKKEERESAAVYCERICNKFKLPYTDRVRQNYNVNETKRLIRKLTENVLPLIDNETKILVEKYLDNKPPPKQKLYA